MNEAHLHGALSPTIVDFNININYARGGIGV
jgi:hypothetical protein